MQNQRRSVAPYQWAARSLAQGGGVDFATLEPDYWRWQNIVYLWKTGAITEAQARTWFDHWLKGDIANEGVNSMWGSINHTIAHAGGRYWASILGLNDSRYPRLSQCLVKGCPFAGKTETFREHQKHNLLHIIRGEGWPRPLDCDPTFGTGQSWGACGEICCSSHYLTRNWCMAWSIADWSPDAEVRAEMRKQMDIGAAAFWTKVRPDGFPHLCQGAEPSRTHSDHCLIKEAERCPCPGGGTRDCGCHNCIQAYPQNWNATQVAVMKAHGLTTDPEDDWVLSYILFGTPWYPDLQGKDWEIVQWSDYAFIGGSGDGWRPLK